MQLLKLFLLLPRTDLSDDLNPWEPWYDKNHGFVIRAENEYEARKLAQENGGDEISYYQAWMSAKFSTCVELFPLGEPCIILSDYMAG